MVLKVRMGNIYHMQQHISFVDLIECTFKRLHELGREFANKSDRITQQKGQITHHHFTYRSVKCSKEFVFGKDFTLAQHIHQCRFSNIGIAYQSDSHQCPTVSALGRHLAIDADQLFL